MASAAVVVRTLKHLGNPGTAAVYKRHGVRERTVGVSYSDLSRVARDLDRDNHLARALWKTGLHDARVLATKIAVPSAIGNSELERWVGVASNYIITDAIAGLAAQSPSADAIARRWLRSRDEWTSAAGWNVVTRRVLERGMTVKACAPLLDRIERSIARAPNRTRYSMNNALIAIGGTFASLRPRARAVARAVGPVEVDHGDTDCKTPDAIPYIERMVARQQKSEKTRRRRVRAARGLTKASKAAKHRAASR